MTLKEYIIESLKDSSTKYDRWVEDFDELLSIKGCERLHAQKYADITRDFINRVIDIADYHPEEMFIYAIGGTYFKIPYAFKEAIDKAAMEPQFSDDVSVNIISGKKVAVYINKSKIFETGSGSIGRVSTEQQETATVKVWNQFISDMRENKEFDASDKTFIRSLVSDITSGFDTEWILTFGKQVMALTAFLQDEGQNPIDYKMCRYGDSSEVGKAYKSYIDAYAAACGGQKDNFDPADVILYKEKNVSEICSILSSLKTKDPDTVIANKASFIEKLFNPHLVVGVSLKKISGKSAAKYIKFNVSGSEKVQQLDSYDIDKRTTDKQVVMFCKGKFDFGKITDGDGDTIDNQNTIQLTLRSFGGKTVGMDVILKKDNKTAPALGKSPVRTWTGLIYNQPCKSTDKPLSVHVESFINWVKNNPKEVVKAGLLEIIKGAIKEGPSCFPFVLIS